MLPRSYWHIRIFCNIVHYYDVNARLDMDVDMNEQNNIQENVRGEDIPSALLGTGLPLLSTVDDTRKGRKAGKAMILAINGLSVLVAIVCFVVIAVWLPLKGPFFDAPLRSLLTGLGLLGIACPPFTLGFLFQKKAATSPYFEEGFIRTGFYIVGFVCFVLGLICIGLSIYALIMRFLGEG